MSSGTAELSINIVQSASHRTGPLHAVGTVIHAGRQIATLGHIKVKDDSYMWVPER